MSAPLTDPRPNEGSGMRSVVLALFATLACAMPASATLAQGTVSTARPAPPEAASLEAPVVSGPVVRVDPKRLELARKIYDLIGAQTMSSTVHSMTTAMSLQFANMMDDRSEVRAKAMVAAVGDGMNSIMPQIIDSSVSAMAHTFTEEQLQDILAFYQSPTGQVMVRKMPVVTQQSNAAIVAYLPQVMAGVEDSFCSRVTCSSKERKGLEAAAARMAAAHPAS
jgi:hypothetical protein